jgi:RNA-directed DNA polymerase
MAAVLNAIY